MILSSGKLFASKCLKHLEKIHHNNKDDWFPAETYRRCVVFETELSTNQACMRIVLMEK
uniref:Uncharacterized protein n=1 Tax=Mastacembelus armatus TaxID=205130 RepID=A0A3Q3L1N9_9TELE